jgi:hypothetical protein
VEQGPQQFLKAFADCWPLVLPQAEVQAIMNLRDDQSFRECKNELNMVCSSSRLGMQCFHFALKLILGESLQSKTDEAVQQLLKMKVITAEAALNCKFCLHVLSSTPATGQASTCV